MKELEVMNDSGVLPNDGKLSYSKLLAACKDYRVLVDRLEAENAHLRADLAECRQTVEDVAIGQALECVTCGKFRPCMCDKGET